MRIGKVVILAVLALFLCNCGGGDGEQPVTPVLPEQTDSVKTDSAKTDTIPADTVKTDTIPTDTVQQPELKPDTTAQPATQRRLSAEAERLLSYLKSIYGKKMLSGAMACVNWNTSEAQWVYKHTGRWPALNCFDFIHHVYSQRGGWIDYSNTSVVEDWHREGGIVAAMWHWNVPAKKSGEYAFYADDTNFDSQGFRRVFVGICPDGEGH